jgi:uncharacterized integral membrane protein
MRDFWNGLDNLGKTKFVSYILLGIFSVLFAVFNWKLVEVNFVLMKWNLPLTIVIVMSMAGGFALSKLLNYRAVRKNEKEIIRLHQEIDKNKPA